MNKQWYEINNVYHNYKLFIINIIKYIRYKVNEQQNFDIDSVLDSYGEQEFWID